MRNLLIWGGFKKNILDSPHRQSIFILLLFPRIDTANFYKSTKADKEGKD